MLQGDFKGPEVGLFSGQFSLGPLLAKLKLWTIGCPCHMCFSSAPRAVLELRFEPICLTLPIIVLYSHANYEIVQLWPGCF